MQVLSTERGPVLKARGKTLGMAQQIARQLDGWVAYWNGLRIFVLGHDRIHNQHVGWQQEYASYFGIHSKGGA